MTVAARTLTGAFGLQIGYGDISPTTQPERLLGCGLMVIGCAFFAWITGSITNIMTSKPACESRFDEIMDDLHTFMAAHHLPQRLHNKIFDYYKVLCQMPQYV